MICYKGIAELRGLAVESSQISSVTIYHLKEHFSLVYLTVCPFATMLHRDCSWETERSIVCD